MGWVEVDQGVSSFFAHFLMIFQSGVELWKIIKNGKKFAKNEVFKNPNLTLISGPKTRFQRLGPSLKVGQR